MGRRPGHPEYPRAGDEEVGPHKVKQGVYIRVCMCVWVRLFVRVCALVMLERGNMVSVWKCVVCSVSLDKCVLLFVANRSTCKLQ